MLEKIAELLNLSMREVWAIEKYFEYFTNMFSSFSLKGFVTSIVAMAEIIVMLLTGLPITPRGEALDLTGYNLVFEEEFNGDTLDTDVWSVRGVGPVRAGYNSGSQIALQDGNLVITGEYLNDGEFGEGWYTGAIKLNEQYKHGYYEIRCIANDKSGFWSAFWLQADSSYNAEVSKGGIGGAEIDIFESNDYMGQWSATSAVHCAGVEGSDKEIDSLFLGRFNANNMTNEYNTYGVEWTEDEYIFYVNGVESIRSSFGDGVSQVPEDVIVSLEIRDADQLKSILNKEDFETKFVVDYVRIYQK